MRTATWSNVGTEVNGATVEEILKQSGLGYNVVKEPIFMDNGGKMFKVPGKFVTRIEGAKGNEGIFGVVGSDYQIIQNADAFDFVNNIVPYGLTFERAGQTYWGGVYIIASLPEYKIFGDAMKTYMIFENNHGGLTSLKSAICPLRILCQNQFAMAFKKAGNKVAIRHTKNAEAKMEEAKHVMQEALGYTNEFKRMAEELTKIKIPVAKEEKILELAFPIGEKDSDIKKERAEANRKSLHELFVNTEDLQNFRGTGWGMLNAYSDLVTHAEPTRKTENWEQQKFAKSFDTKPMDAFIEIMKVA